jgi:glucosamine--fructose-6-phosphate aminotransferase (isomerizing)
VAGDGYFLASDVPAFLDYTDTVVYLEDGDFVTVRPDDHEVRNGDREPVDRDREQVDWDADETGKGQYDHFMLKEIHSQPTSLSNTLEGRVDADRPALDEFDPHAFDDVEAVHFVGCGTSYHAAMFGATLLNQAGLSARAIRASEYDLAAADPPAETAFVAVTQSGETADTLGALRRANEAGMRTLAVTNVVQSSAAREADTPLYIRAGPEIGVAATKTFTSQAATLTILDQHLVGENPMADPLDDVDDLLEDLQSLPSQFRDLLASSDAERLARRYIDHESYFFIGRGLDRPVAKEGALKFKEITYEHAEGFASGELKHGPLALVTPSTPVVAICTGDAEKTVINAKEANARGAPILAVAPADHEITSFADARLTVPDVHPACASLLANLQLQLFSYHSATQLGRAIDKPRNLAKSVTVE